MSDWDIIWTSSAVRDMNKIPLADRERIDAAVGKLAQDPRFGDCKKMRGKPERWRMRVGDWRVVFKLDRANRQVEIREVFNRQAGY